MKILITAGPTREAIDPVRYITNRSSGKMGYAIAESAAHATHKVLLISGPTHLAVPAGIDYIQVESAAEMYLAVADYLPKMDAAVFAAAVSDYSPAVPWDQKIKKTANTLTLELIKNKDILGSARGEMGFQGVLVGFAAETNHLEDYAREKLVKKQCDLIVANDVSRSDIGFDSEENEALLVFPDHTEAFAKASKYDLADRIVSIIYDKLESQKREL